MPLLRRQSSVRAGGAEQRLLQVARWRLAAWSWLITLALLLVLGTLVYASVAASLAANGRQQLELRAGALAAGLIRFGPPVNSNDRPFPIGVAFGGPTSGTFGIMVAPDGRVIGPGEPAVAGLPFAPGVAAARAGVSDYQELTLAGVPVRLLSDPASYQGQLYVIQVLADRGPDDRTLGALLLVLALSGALGLTVALAGAWVVAGRGLLPVRVSMRRQRAFAADASHELRTPLSIVRADLEDLYRHPEAGADARAATLVEATNEIDHITQVVDALLLLARADSGTSTIELRALDLVQIATPILARYTDIAAEQGIRLEITTTPAPMNGDAERLAQMIEVLLNGAVRRAAPDAPIKVTVGRTGRSVFFAVSGGPARSDDRLEGDRLGSAVASWVAEAHGGSLHARPGATGTMIEVKMPIAHRQPARPA
jgi:signal transduction histidine kinase